MGELNRASAADAEVIMAAVCPDFSLRQEVLSHLLNSIDFAESVAPEAWAVTLFGNGFRLNVGQVEALTCDTDELQPGDGRPVVRVLTQGILPAEVLAAVGNRGSLLEVAPIAYKCIPAPQHIVLLPMTDRRQLAHWLDQLSQAHHRYVSLAARTNSGKPRAGTPFRRSHSRGLVEYAETICRGGVIHSISASEGEDGMAQGVVPPDFFEGRPIAVQTTRYERDVNARRACLAHHGYRCAACGFDFGSAYGAVAGHYIQVHHLNPLASHGREAAVDPIADMRPLCANCHAVAHFRNPPYAIEEIKSFINKEHLS